MLPMVAVSEASKTQHLNEDFKSLLNTLQEGEIGTLCKTDKIILMIGNRSFTSSKRKSDKKIEGQKTTRAQMRLFARVYLAFKGIYKGQNEVILVDQQNNSADIFRRETITILGQAINKLCEKPEDNTGITAQKSASKVAILNLLKLCAKYLIGHFLGKNLDVNAKHVTDFLQVLKLFQDDIFGDAFYDINYKRNVESRKPINLPSDSDVQILLDECRLLMNIDAFEFPTDNYLKIRSAVITTLVIFNARRGGEPVRLTLKQWQEALSGDWVDEDESNDMLVTYQTGKGPNHLVPVFFPSETHQAMKFMCDANNRRLSGILPTNNYIFASKSSKYHTSGWHAINDVLESLSLKGAINATRNRHRVASLLAKLNLSDQEKELIYDHFGHSKSVNKNRYQAAAGSMQIQHTGKKLLQLNKQRDVTNSSTCNSVSVATVKSPGTLL